MGEQAPPAPSHRKTVLPGFITFLVCGAFLLFIYWYLNMAPLPFDRAKWDAEITETIYKSHMRQRMADGLLRSKALIGKSRADVVALLGEPPPTEYFDEYDLVYWLGRDRSFIGVDSEWLVMRLGASSVVSDAKIVVD